MNRTTFLALSILLASGRAAFAGANLAKVYIPTPGAKQMSALTAAINIMGGDWQKGVWSRALAENHPLLAPMAVQVTPTYEKLLTELAKAEKPDIPQIEAILLEMTDRARDYAYEQAGRLTMDKIQGLISDEDLAASPTFAADVKAAYGPYLVHGPLLALGWTTLNLEKRRLAFLEQKKAKTMGLAEETSKRLSDENTHGTNFQSVSFKASDWGNPAQARFGSELRSALAEKDDQAFQEAVKASYRTLANEGDEAAVQGQALHAFIEKLMADAGRPGAATRTQHKGSAREMLSWEVVTDFNDQGLRMVLDAIAKKQAGRVALKRAGSAAAAVMGRTIERLATQLGMKDDEAFKDTVEQAYQSLRAELSLDALSGPASLETAKTQVAELHAAIASLMKTYGQPKAARITRLIGGLNEGIPVPVEYDINDAGRDELLRLVSRNIPGIAAGLPRASFAAIKAPGAKSTAMPLDLLLISNFYENVITKALAGSSEDKKAVLEKLENGFDGKVQPIQDVKYFFWGNSASTSRLFGWQRVLDNAAWLAFGAGSLVVLLTIVPAIMGALPWGAPLAGAAVFAGGLVSSFVSRRVEKISWKISSPRWVDLYYKLRNWVEVHGGKS